MSLRKLALFDLDHTLIPMDSDHSWGEFTMALGWVNPEEFKRQNDAFYEQYKNGTLDIEAYVRFSTAAFCQQGAEKSMAAHMQYMHQVVHAMIRPPAVDLIRKHQDAGDDTIIVTATNEFVTRPIAKAFGVDELIAVDLERDTTPGSEGWFTSTIRGIPSFRDGKVARVHAWLAARDLHWNQVHSTFYSDSINDLPLLEKVDVPVATNPDERLRAVAVERGWRILELF
jgi:HAD superfamily hydrolase (TIGR01490 family)